MPSSKNKKKREGKAGDKNVKVANKLHCLECDQEIGEQQHFFTRTQTCKKCGMVTRCKTSFSQHRLLCLCDVRWPFGAPPQNHEEIMLGCSGCQFVSKSTRQIALHIAQHKPVARIAIIAKMQDIDFVDNEYEKQLFGLSNNSSVMDLERDESLFGILKEFVRPDQAAITEKSALMCKHLLTVESNDMGSSSKYKDLLETLRLALEKPVTHKHAAKSAKRI